jgi:anti-sigma regulatory factor (Ser/Thr protein kinase)
MQSRGIEDLKTVISEACANVVLHAYPSDADERPLEVELAREGDALEAIVRDRGQGIQPYAEAKPPGLRLGLLLIGAMASCFQLRSAHDRGTELLVRFPLPAS